MVCMLVEAIALEIDSEGFLSTLSEHCAPVADVYGPDLLPLLKMDFFPGLALPAYILLSEARDGVV